jgi:hypothetical protein
MSGRWPEVGRGVLDITLEDFEVVSVIEGVFIGNHGVGMRLTQRSRDERQMFPRSQKRDLGHSLGNGWARGKTEKTIKNNSYRYPTLTA